MEGAALRKNIVTGEKVAIPRSLRHRRKCLLKHVESRGIKQDKKDTLERRWTAQVFSHLFKHDLGAPAERKPGYACAKRREGNGG